jgi:hypothetical protein
MRRKQDEMQNLQAKAVVRQYTVAPYGWAAFSNSILLAGALKCRVVLQRCVQ